MGYEEHSEFQLIRTTPQDAALYLQAAEEMGTLTVRVTDPMHPDISPEVEGTQIVTFTATPTEQDVLRGYMGLLRQTEL